MERQMVGLQNKNEVLVIGAAIVDIPLQPVNKNIFEIESCPLNRIAMTIGGDAINEATIITRLGHPTMLMSMVGNDVPGKFVMEHCRSNNIDISKLKVRDEIDTSINIGLVTEDGERTFVTNRNGSLWKLDFIDLDSSVFDQVRLLSFASFFNNPLLKGQPLVELFQKAKEKQLILCADMVKSRFGEGLEAIRDALAYVDYFFPNYDEASLMTGKTKVEEIADVFLDCGVKNMIIKVGKRGCFIKNREKQYLVPGYPDSNCIDTIGAGDNFASGFIAALLEGKDLKECGMYANAVASISVESLGATTGVQNRAHVDERYQAYLKRI
ncbi:MAG: carbohydrate kinase family protein [Lachnospiraceae bacterium]